MFVFHTQLARGGRLLVIVAPLAVVVAKLIHGQLLVVGQASLTAVLCAWQGYRHGQLLRRPMHMAPTAIEWSADQRQMERAWSPHDGTSFLRVA
jgi:hypothetical protein